jgi:hypothetical protein
VASKSETRKIGWQENSNESSLISRSSFIVLQAL